MSCTTIEVTEEVKVIKQDLRITINIKHHELRLLKEWLQEKKDDDEPACLCIIREHLESMP